MPTSKRMNAFAGSLLGFLLSAVLLTAACPITAYAAADNPTYGTLDVFPGSSDSTDTMDVNAGTIGTLSSGGTVKDNAGTISVSCGTVYENHGTIDRLSSGHAGTNYGVINQIENTGSLGENDPEGTVFFLGMGNVITRNDGTVQKSAGMIDGNYGTVGENHGTVRMYDGQIVSNERGGTVLFEAKIADGAVIPAKGRIDSNKGTVRVGSGTVTVKENTGTVEITNASVTVEKNSGSITLGAGARLICEENTGDGTIIKTDKSAEIVCGSSDGLILDETAARYRIVFVGDDGKGEILACDLEIGGVFYTLAGGSVVFSLPPEYKCSDANEFGPNTWVSDAFPAEEDTEFTIVCVRRLPCDSLGHDFGTYIPNGDAACTKDGTKTAFCAYGCGASDTVADTGSAKGHVFGEWVTVREATETGTGEKERICSVCSDKETDVIPVLVHVHSGTLLSGTSASCTEAGVKDRYVCACGRTFEDAACKTGIADADVWKAEGGSGYIAPGGHVFGEWKTAAEPTLTETGTRERACSVCGAKETEEIPVLTPVSYRVLSGADGEWTKGSADGLVLVSEADFAKFVCVRVDGAELPAGDYTAVSGSTRVTLHAAYLETLDEGNHSAVIVSADGSASASFTVNAAERSVPADPTEPSAPQTGDDGRTFLRIAILLVGCGAFAVSAGKRKRAD